MILNLARSVSLSGMAVVGIAMMTSSVSAATVTGNVEWGGYNAYAFVPDFTFDDGKAYAFDLILCLTRYAQNPRPDEGPYSFESNAGGAVLVGGGGNLGIAALNYMMDSFYTMFFKGGTWEQQYAFQQITWELGSVFDESDLSSFTLDNAIGNPSYPNDAAYLLALNSMYDGISAVLPTLSTSYKSQKYTLDFLDSEDPGIQNFMAISETAPAPVPVPAALPLAISGLGALGLMSRRKRAKA